MTTCYDAVGFVAGLQKKIYHSLIKGLLFLSLLLSVAAPALKNLREMGGILM